MTQVFTVAFPVSAPPTIMILLKIAARLDTLQNDRISADNHKTFYYNYQHELLLKMNFY